MMLQRLATGSTGVEQARYRRSLLGAARHSHAHAQYIHSLSVYSVYTVEGPWHLLFNVRQRMVYMNSAEGFAL